MTAPTPLPPPPDGPRRRLPRAAWVALLLLAGVELGLFGLAAFGRSHAPARPRATPGPAGAPAAAGAPGGRQRGVCLVGGRAVDPRLFDRLAARGVTWISQTPFGWQRRYDEPDIRLATAGHAYWGETDSGLVVTARLARAHGIHTLLKPHLWLVDRADGHWEGSIAMRSEADWRRWFDAYQRFVLHYARLAEDSGMEALCVGTELEGTTGRAADWRRVIAAVRRVYHGRLVYAANWSGEFERIAFWDALDEIGLQAYFPLADRPNATVAQLVHAWRPHEQRIAAVARRFDRPVVFTEIGYRAAAGAAIEPWRWRTTDAADPTEQARAYEAAFRVFWDEPWFDGMYWWKWFPTAGAGRHGHERLFSPQDRPAEEVLARWYRQRPPAG